MQKAPGKYPTNRKQESCFLSFVDNSTYNSSSNFNKISVRLSQRRPFKYFFSGFGSVGLFSLSLPIIYTRSTWSKSRFLCSGKENNVFTDPKDRQFFYMNTKVIFLSVVLV